MWPQCLGHSAAANDLIRGSGRVHPFFKPCTCKAAATTVRLPRLEGCPPVDGLGVSAAADLRRHCRRRLLTTLLLEGKRSRLMQTAAGRTSTGMFESIDLDLKTCWRPGAWPCSKAVFLRRSTGPTRLEAEIAKVAGDVRRISSPPSRNWSARGAWFPTVIAPPESASSVAGLTATRASGGGLTPLNIHLSYVAG